MKEEIKETKKFDPKEEIRRIQSWIAPKQIQIEELQMRIEEQALAIRQIKANIKSRFFIRQQEKVISEQTNPFGKEIETIKLLEIKNSIEKGYKLKKAELELSFVKDYLKKEIKIVNALKKKITLLEKNKSEETKNV